VGTSYARIRWLGMHLQQVTDMIRKTGIVVTDLTQQVLYVDMHCFFMPLMEQCVTSGQAC